MIVTKLKETSITETPHKLDVRKLYNSDKVVRVLVVKAPKPITKTKLL